MTTPVRAAITAALCLAVACAAPTTPQDHEQPVPQSGADFDVASSSLDLAVAHANTMPVRIALTPLGNVYVSDPSVGSVFLYDANLTPLAELKGLGSPLGLAFDPAHEQLLLGDASISSLVRTGPLGEVAQIVDLGGLQKPTDVTVDGSGRVLAVDSASGWVRVYDPATERPRLIGQGLLRYPAAVAVSDELGEIFVGDQVTGTIEVFDTDGSHLRSLGGKAVLDTSWKGRFVRIQALDFDSEGLLHVLDCFLGRVQVIDPRTGTFQRSYGEPGRDRGQLAAPLDLVLLDDGRALIANTQRHRLEVLGD